MPMSLSVLKMFFPNHEVLIIRRGGNFVLVTVELEGALEVGFKGDSFAFKLPLSGTSWQTTKCLLDNIITKNIACFPQVISFLYRNRKQVISFLYRASSFEVGDSKVRPQPHSRPKNNQDIIKEPHFNIEMA